MHQSLIRVSSSRAFHVLVGAMLFMPLAVGVLNGVLLAYVLFAVCALIVGSS